MKATFKQPYDFLTRHKIAVLSTATDKHDVWGAAIYYAVDESLSFYFLTKKGTKKYHQILKNPHGAVTVADDAEQTTVQASGSIKEVSTGEERDQAYRKLALVHPAGDFSWKPPVTKMDDGETVLLKLTSQTLQYANFQSSSQDSTDHIVQVI